MIFVDVEVPILGKVYDFQIEEEVLLGEVIEEISAMICHKEQCMLKGTHKEFMLWDAEGGKRLVMEKTARESKIRSGSHLMLV